MSFSSDFESCREDRELTLQEVSDMTDIPKYELILISRGGNEVRHEVAESLVHRYCLIGCPKFRSCAVPNKSKKKRV